MVKGFTLSELMIGLAITSIVTLFSAKPLTKFLEKNKVEADVLKVVNIINTSRAKAISKKQQYTICGDTDGNNGAAQCSRSWRALKVVDAQHNLKYTAELSANLASANWYAFQSKPGLTISPTGYTAHQNGTLYLCHRQYQDLHRAIIVSKSGRTTVGGEPADIALKCQTQD